MVFAFKNYIRKKIGKALRTGKCAGTEVDRERESINWTHSLTRLVHDCGPAIDERGHHTCILVLLPEKGTAGRLPLHHADTLCWCGEIREGKVREKWKSK